MVPVYTDTADTQILWDLILVLDIIKLYEPTPSMWTNVIVFEQWKWGFDRCQDRAVTLKMSLFKAKGKVINV